LGAVGGEGFGLVGECGQGHDRSPGMAYRNDDAMVCVGAVVSGVRSLR